MSDHKPTGGCMCGAVRYELDGTPTWNVYCHCRSCRKHTGAPVSVLITCVPEQVRWTAGERVFYESSPGRFRAFCRDCGTPLTWETEVKDNAWLGIHVSTLDHPEHFQPVEHVFHGHAIPWFDTADDLPRHDGTKFAEFGVREPGWREQTPV